MKHLKWVTVIAGISLCLMSLAGCSNEQVSKKDYMLLLEENNQLKAACQKYEKLLAENNQSEENVQDEAVKTAEVLHVKITGGFSATVRDTLPDYCFDSETPSVAVVTLFQDGPFVLDVGQEIAKQLEVGKTYYFEVVDQEIDDLTKEEYNRGYADPVTVMRKYHVGIADVREPAEDELGLECVKLNFEQID